MLKSQNPRQEQQQRTTDGENEVSPLCAVHRQKVGVRRGVRPPPSGWLWWR
jgi:hypothetical protein